jgi:hypothetical protein
MPGGKVLMPSTKAGKVAAGIAGVTGTGSLGVTVAAVTRIAAAHAVPIGIWIVLAALSVATVVVAGLGLVLDYRRDRLELETRARAEQAQADREKTRLEMYRTLVEKSAGEPASAASYRSLILADALHLAVEQGNVRPADRTHGQLYGVQSGEPGVLAENQE